MLITDIAHEIVFQWNTHIKKSVLLMTPLSATTFLVTLIVGQVLSVNDAFPNWLVGILTATITVLLSIIAFVAVQVYLIVKKEISSNNVRMDKLLEVQIKHGNELIRLSTEVENLKEDEQPKKKRLG